MKNILTFSIIAFLAALTSCSSEDILGDVQVTEPKEGTEAAIPDVVSGDASRSELYYDNGSMSFMWNAGDGIAIYPKFVDADKQGFPSAEASPRTDYLYVLETAHAETNPALKGYVTGKFGVTDDESSRLTIAGTTEFYAWSPNTSTRQSIATPEYGYLEMPVDFTGQRQASNVAISYYQEDNAAYTASEKAASGHLGDYDFMYSYAKQVHSNLYTYFGFKHVPGIVRFYMKVPDPDVEQVFDSLLLFRKNEGLEQYKFTTKGTFDMEAEVLTPTEQPSMLKLLLGTNGFDLIDHDSESPRYGKTSNLYLRKGNYIMICYMAVAPVDLMLDDHPKPILYLCSHTGTGDNMIKKYYKATLAKKKIEAGKLYQWSSALDEEEPITFEEIEVEEWKEEVGYTNTVTDSTSGEDKEGHGTENW